MEPVLSALRTMVWYMSLASWICLRRSGPPGTSMEVSIFGGCVSDLSGGTGGKSIPSTQRPLKGSEIDMRGCLVTCGAVLRPLQKFRSLLVVGFSRTSARFGLGLSRSFA